MKIETESDKLCREIGWFIDSEWDVLKPMSADGLYNHLVGVFPNVTREMTDRFYKTAFGGSIDED